MSDQRDLLERLRSAANSNELRHEAADEIARLRSICNGTVWEENECLQALLASASERVAEMQHEAGMYHSLYDVATERLASARKALEGVLDHMDRNGMMNWPVAKRVRKELDALRRTT